MKLSYLCIPVVLLVGLAMALGACDISPPPEDAGLDLPPCSGSISGSGDFDEGEPNDGSTEAEVNVVGPEVVDGNVTIRGTSSSCGNDGINWTGDIDVFQVNFACMGDATFELDWNGADADLDYNVLATAWSVTQYASVGYSYESESPEAESEQVEGLGGPMLIRIMCWDGGDAGDDDDSAADDDPAGGYPWTFTITWPEAQGDDDDSAGDDDDSAGDDDDSAGDDDDSAGDDDDSPGDDDDSAGDDDDSAGDDDDSAGDDDDSSR